MNPWPTTLAYADCSDPTHIENNEGNLTCTGATTNPSTYVPIYQTLQSPSAWLRQSVFVQIGNSAPVEAMLDTGSTGLRVLDGVLSPSDYTDTGKPSVAVFGAGNTGVLTGKVGLATVKIGALTTEAPIPIQVVAPNGVGCLPAKPNCGFGKDSTSIFGMGSTGHKFKAILGIGLNANSDIVGNPLTAMGNHSWIISLGQPTTVTPGSLILNPTADQVAGYTLFHLPKQTKLPPGVTTAWIEAPVNQ